jgi:hypothetical protein
MSSLHPLYFQEFYYMRQYFVEMFLPVRSLVPVVRATLNRTLSPKRYHRVDGGRWCDLTK